MASSSGRRLARRGDPHGWNDFQNYLTVHHRYLDELRGYFVLEDDLEYDFVAPSLFEIRGRVRCLHGLSVDVDKTLEVDARTWVRTIKYSYHAGVEGDRERTIFRYDNAHRYVREGHADEHHKHRFDHSGWQEIEPPVWIGRERWPHLNQVIEELCDWWDDIGSQLDLAERPSACGADGGG